MNAETLLKISLLVACVICGERVLVWVRINVWELTIWLTMYRVFRKTMSLF